MSGSAYSGGQAPAANSGAMDSARGGRNDRDRLNEIEAYSSEWGATFDTEPDQGLADSVVRGVDLSEAMVAQAKKKAKAAGVPVEFRVGDASDAQLQDRHFDVVLSRHLVRTLLDPRTDLRRRVRLLERTGRLGLIEGQWSTQQRRRVGWREMVAYRPRSS